MIQQLAIDQLEYDMHLQPRARLHDDWIGEYAQDMASGAEFPPIVVFFDNEHYWLADGFHRCHAAKMAGLVEINADVREGTRRDALLHSLSANAEHGHRRTNADKQRAVDIVLSDSEWGGWSDREIASQIGVSHEMVRSRRKNICQTLTDSRLVSRCGTTYEMDTSNIGHASNVRAEADAKAPLLLATKVARPPEGQQQNLVDADEAMLRTTLEASQPSALEPTGKIALLSLAPSAKRYGLLYADPWSAMTLDNLRAQSVPAADNSVILLRALRVDDAVHLMESWNFAYADNFAWNKGGSEPGYYVNYQYELFLIGTRGGTLIPVEAKLSSILHAASRHDLTDFFAALFPSLAKVELFAQTARSGWDAWRPEPDSDDAVEAAHVAADLAAA
jgi:N6-adenosine-specific RNA methylase IME4